MKLAIHYHVSAKKKERPVNKAPVIAGFRESQMYAALLKC